jgi:hypothetical protein
VSAPPNQDNKDGKNMRKTGRISLVSVMLAAIIISAVACTSNTTLSAEDNAIRAYADPATETTLQGLSEDNLAKYTQYGDSAFNAALSQAILDSTAVKINNQYGVFISAEFQSTARQQGYTVVYYKAKYAKGSITVKMVFDTDQKVAGQWFQ